MQRHAVWLPIVIVLLSCGGKQDTPSPSADGGPPQAGASSGGGAKDAASQSNDATKDKLPIGAAKSGSRLKLRGYAADGASYFDSIYDTQEEVGCFWNPLQVEEDGYTQVCVPNTVFESAVGFLDDACTKRYVAFKKTSCATQSTAPKIAWYEEGDFCDSSYRQYYAQAGAPITVDQPLYTLNDSNSSDCFQSSSMLNPDYDYFELEPVAAGRIVRGAARELPVAGTSLVQHVIEGEDGSITPDVLTDGSESCWWESLDLGGTTICAPYAASAPVPKLFDDTSCQGLPVFPESLSCGKPYRQYVALRNQDVLSAECGILEHLHRLGGTRSVGSILDDGTCMPWTSSSGQPNQGYDLGMEVSLDNYDHFTRILVGSGRVRQILYESEMGERVDPGRLLDTKFGQNCTPQLAQDGTYRCAPYTMFQNVFLDAACSEAGLRYAGRTCLNPSGKQLVTTSEKLSSDDCAPNVIAKATEYEHEDIPVYVSQVGNCVEQTPSSAKPAYRQSREIGIEGLGEFQEIEF